MGHAERRNHSEACRARIEEEMAKSEVGKDKLQRTKDRLDLKTAQMGEGIMMAEEMDVTEETTELVDGPQEARDSTLWYGRTKI